MAAFSLQLDMTVNNAALVLYAAMVHELLENLITPSGTCFSCWQAISLIVLTTNKLSTRVVCMNEATNMNACKFYG